jgi:tetratricopeptide (TPR) repeat protein
MSSSTDAKETTPAAAEAPPLEDWQVQRDAFKAQGDAAFRLGHSWAAAIRAYTEALSLDPEHAALLSNRSAAYLRNGQKSAALHDAQACVKLGTLALKGKSRLAAALQALGRYRPALLEWQSILQEDATYAAALQGVQTCQAALPPTEDDNKVAAAAPAAAEGDDSEDDLADFFNEVEDATEAVVQQKKEEATSSTSQIKKHKENLGSVTEQLDRLLADNYQWRNLNPFFVMDLPHTATVDEIQRRYKALSLLLHPDKNPGHARAQEAYDEILQAKAKLLDDPDKANHARQLVAEGVKHGERDFRTQKATGAGTNSSSLKDCQDKAVQRIFAEVEYKRRTILERERAQEQRERSQEEEGVQKERQEVKFNKSWKEEDRVGKRVGNWRSFEKKKKPKV